MVFYPRIQVSNLQQEGDFASAKVSYTGIDNQRHNEVWCFRRLDGKWCGDALGLKSAKPLKVSDYDGASMEVAANIGYTYKNDIIIAFDVRSKTTTNYTLGQWGQPSYVLVTDKGEFPAQNLEGMSAPSGFFQITSAQPLRLYIPFKSATGKPKALRITGFNEIDNQGFPVGNDMAQIVTFSLSE